MKIVPDIPIIYPDKFPADLVNDVNKWAFSPTEMKESKGKLLTLDIDFGNFCTLNCPHCFRRDNKVDFGSSKQMNFTDILKIVKEGKKLGLQSVKFLGAGEPFEDLRFLEFLQELKKLDIIPVIFSKGHVIGDDNLAARYNHHYGVKNSEELVTKLSAVNTSILLGFNSFDSAIQDKMVGGVKGYTAKRNRALELLVKARFNQHNPTHLCLAANPITHGNYNELLEIYKWGRLRGMYVIVCPTMVSGRCAKERDWRNITPSPAKLIDLYTKIYRFNIKKRLQSKEQIIREGIASYAGGHPCNQIACGMYITLTGKVLRCPGDDVTVFGNIWEESLADIWHKSENFKRAGQFNCGCPPKCGKSIPSNLFAEVMKNVGKM
ncbi:radical SAM protein [Patescibacteria group bacterium]|nr:radical SAM protein [Patescibacteria group bacterium]